MSYFGKFHKSYSYEQRSEFENLHKQKIVSGGSYEVLLDCAFFIYFLSIENIDIISLIVTKIYFSAPCGAGQYKSNNECIACQIGMFQKSPLHAYKMCEFCAKETITLTTGSKSIDSCVGEFTLCLLCFQGSK